MEQKIFNSDKSRIKRDLDKLFQHYWWLRSACNDNPFTFQCCIALYGSNTVIHTKIKCGIIPTCAI